MILIDYSQVAISNIAVQLAMSKDKNILSIPMVRHMILNSIRGYVHRFRNDYPGEVVLGVEIFLNSIKQNVEKVEIMMTKIGKVSLV